MWRAGVSRTVPCSVDTVNQSTGKRFELQLTFSLGVAPQIRSACKHTRDAVSATISSW